MDAGFKECAWVQDSQDLRERRAGFERGTWVQVSFFLFTVPEVCSATRMESRGERRDGPRRAAVAAPGLPAARGNKMLGVGVGGKTQANAMCFPLCLFTLPAGRARSLCKKVCLLLLMQRNGRSMANIFNVPANRQNGSDPKSHSGEIVFATI